MNINNDDRLWSLWATAIHRIARSAKAGTGAAGCPQIHNLAVFRARRRSLFPLWANKPAGERMARRRDRSLGARTVAGTQIALARKGQEEHARI
ncbi:MAG: hypothetical protein LBE06_08485, partial [Azoarcus sp.]|nr:hypothetical protein [Azoarcus sp.]